MNIRERKPPTTNQPPTTATATSSCPVAHHTVTHLPGSAKVVGALDEHGCRPEGLECDDQMSEVKLSLQVQLYRNILHSVLRLPP